MSINESSNDEPHFAAIGKKTYEKPGFRHEPIFVTSALTCGKMTDGTQSQCMMNPKVS